MKLTRALIENFKGVKRCEIDFASHTPGSPRWLTALVGDNGSGKTTVLQAIALTLSMATRRTRRAEELRWHGFLAERLGSQGPTRVTLDVMFERSEVEETRRLFEMWRDPARTNVAPSMHENVQLVYEQGRVSSPQGAAAYFQFLGRYYIKTLLGTNSEVRSSFRKVGDVFWFDQHRNLGSRVETSRRPVSIDEPLSHPDLLPEAEPAPEYEESWTAGVERLRENLIKWWGYHTSPNRNPADDYLERLEPYLTTIFPGVQLAGVRPRFSGGLRTEFYFEFERAGLRYDIAEISSGEQAVFPILSEFARLDIARSLVLIDELELHLHPPEQQALLAALRKLGPDCQFIITTHSPYLTEVIPSEEIVRLEGGRPCL